MKTLKVSFITLSLLVLFSSAQAQNNSADKSNVMISNYWDEFAFPVDCSGYQILFKGTVQEITKQLPDGTFTIHFNAFGEGVDQDGGLWTLRETWNSRYETTLHETDRLVFRGPDGQKLEGRVLTVVNGKGELVQLVFESPC